MTDPVCDLLVLGSGVAGLSAAVRARRAGMSVTVLTKGELGWSATQYAQGGVAAALDPADDSPELHGSDTLAAGGRALRHRRGAPARERRPGAGARAGRAGRALRPGRRRRASSPARGKAGTRSRGSCTRGATPPAPRSSGRWSPRCWVRAPTSASGGSRPTSSSSTVGSSGCTRDGPDGSATVRAPPRARRHRRGRAVLRGHHQPRALHRRRRRHGHAGRVPRSPTSSSCSSTRRRCTTRRCRARCSRRRSGVRARSCATSTASRSCATSIRWPTSRRATSSPRRSAALHRARSRPPLARRHRHRRLRPAVPDDLGGVPVGRARPDPRPAPGRARRALPLGRRVHRPRRRHHAARAVGVRRGRVHRGARGQPPGVELAARRVWCSRRGSSRRSSPVATATSPPACCAVSERATRRYRCRCARSRARRSATSCSGS